MAVQFYSRDAAGLKPCATDAAVLYEAPDLLISCSRTVFTDSMTASRCIPKSDIISSMDLRQLEIVQAVAETGSFTGAGRKLHVSQSAISRQILLLEDELNESIFLRVGRKVRITPAGESLVQLSHRVFGDIKETVTVIGDSQQVLSGTIRLAGGMTVCMYVFPMLLQE